MNNSFRVVAALSTGISLLGFASTPSQAFSIDEVYGEVSGSVSIQGSSSWAATEGEIYSSGSTAFSLFQGFSGTPLVDTRTFEELPPSQPLKGTSGKSKFTYLNETLSDVQAMFGRCIHHYFFDGSATSFEFDTTHSGGYVSIVRARNETSTEEEYHWFARIRIFDGVGSNPHTPFNLHGLDSGPCGGKDLPDQNTSTFQKNDAVVRGVTFLLPVDFEPGRPLHLHYSVPLAGLRDLPQYSADEYPVPIAVDQVAYFNANMIADPLMNTASYDKRASNSTVNVNIDLTINGWAIESADMLKALNISDRNTQLAEAMQGLDIQGADAKFTEALIWLRKNYPDLFPKEGQTVLLTFRENIQDESQPDTTVLGVTDVDSRDITIGYSKSVSEYVDVLAHELLHSRAERAKNYLERHYGDDSDEHAFIKAFGRAVAAHYNADIADPSFKRAELSKTEFGWPLIQGNHATIATAIDAGSGLPYNFSVRSLWFQDKDN
jgi:hypothetical protein